MKEVAEVYSWMFVYNEWNKLKRLPIQDRGFEESFREYISRKVKFDKVSDIRDTGFGLSYPTFSGLPHELDAICVKDKELSAFELKHYEVSNITKDIVFTFWGKIIDFYFKNAEVLSNYKITMFLVTINKSVDESIRKLCIGYGIKLIEPSLMTIGTLDYFARDIYQKLLDHDNLKLCDELIEDIRIVKERYDYSFSDIFRYKDGEIKINLPLDQIKPEEALNKILECYKLFKKLKDIWNSQKN